MPRHLAEVDPDRAATRAWWRRWVLAGAAAVALIILGWGYVEVRTTQAVADAIPPTTRTATVSSVQAPGALACRELAQAATITANALDKAFEEHAHAHHQYVRGKMKLGAKGNPAPGTVRFVWRETLAKRQMLSPQYRRLAAAVLKECRA